MKRRPDDDFRAGIPIGEYVTLWLWRPVRFMFYGILFGMILASCVCAALLRLAAQ